MFRVVRQHDERDCGPASLAMIARFHGTVAPISRFRELTRTNLRGCSLLGLVEGASAIGLRGAAHKGTLEELQTEIEDGTLPLPLIAHVKDKGLLHYVVVVASHRAGLIVADPARGKVRQAWEEFATSWTGYVVTFRPGIHFAPERQSAHNFRRVQFLLRGELLSLFFILAISLVVSGIGVLGALSFQVLVDGVLQTDSRQSATQGPSALVDGLLEFLSPGFGGQVVAILFPLMLFLYGISAVIQWIRGRLILLMTRRIDSVLLNGYLDHLLGLPISSVAMRRTGEYISRISDVSAIRAAVSTTAISLVLDATMVVGGGLVLYFQVGALFGLAFIVVATQGAIFLAFRRRLERVNRAAMESNSQLQSFAKEAIDGIESIKAANAAPSVNRSMSGKITDYVDSLFSSGMAAISQETLVSAVQMIGTVIILWMGFGLVVSGQISLGSLITFYALLAFFLQPVRNLVDLQPVLQAASIAGGRLNDIQDLPCEVVGNAHSSDQLEASCWELRHVSFSYDFQAPALRDVSLSVRKGERVAIVGESGSGKSTLAKLLVRFYPVQSGRVAVDGTSLEDVDLWQLRSVIGYVSQSTYLFNDTVLNNVKLGCEWATAQDVRDACVLSGADDFISALPMGYSTILDENGGNLSGGQRQRLSIARAFLKKPRLLILDEATSDLDGGGEAHVWNSVESLGPDVAALVISHSMRLASACDRVYVLSKGSIVEAGRHEELLAANGPYAKMWERSSRRSRVEREIGLGA